MQFNLGHVVRGVVERVSSTGAIFGLACAPRIHRPWGGDGAEFVVQPGKSLAEAVCVSVESFWILAVAGVFDVRAEVRDQRGPHRTG